MLLSEFLLKWGWFQVHIEGFPKYLGWILLFQKPETVFCGWKSTDKNSCTFLLAKEKTWKRIFNTNSELLQNRAETPIMVFETTVNWLFHDIWCYLVIGCFDWKIGLLSTNNSKEFIVSLIILISILKWIKKLFYYSSASSLIVIVM